jgi:lipoate-protein ligase A
MIWRFIDSGSNTGEFNMGYDLELTRNCKTDEAYFRLYRWSPFAISLGANQNFDDIDLSKCREDNIDVVKRPTGGRAILHAEEITYSVILPLDFHFSPREIYFKISTALIRGLKLYNHLLAKLELENVQPDYFKLLEEPAGVLCFASTAKNEVKFNEKKLIGSAQRRMNNVVLQHGSILCGPFHRKLADYIKADDPVKSELKNGLGERTTELSSILKEEINYERLKTCLKNGFEIEWEFNFSID